MADDVTIIIGADSSKLQREVADATEELNRLRTAQERLKRPSVELDAAIAKVAKRLDEAKRAAHVAGVDLQGFGDRAESSMAKAAKAAALTGDAFGGLAGPLGDVGDAFGLMSPQAAAATVAITALVGAGAALVSNTIEVVRNLDDYAGMLGENEAALRATKEAVDAYDESSRYLSVTLAGLTSGPIGDFALMLAGVNYAAADAAAALGQFEGGLDKIDKVLRVVAGPVYLFLSGLAKLAAAYGRLRADQEEAKRTTEEQAEAVSGLMDEYAKEAQGQMALWQRFYEGRNKTTEEGTVAIREQTVAIRENAAARRSIQIDIGEPVFTDLPVEAPTVTDTVGSAFGSAWAAAEADLNSFRKASNDAAAEQVEVWKSAQWSIVQSAAGFALSLSDMIVEISERTTGESRKERIKHFRTMKAAALVEASINTALGVTQSLGSAPFPANIVLGALTLAAGAVQIGLIASKQPTFHRGGIMRGPSLAPDESSRMGARTRTNEAIVLTQQAMGALSGTIARINAGEPAAQQPAPVYVMVSGRPHGTRGFARPDPGFGRGGW